MNIRQTAIPRRVLSLALCAAMVLTLLPLPTPAEGICGHHPEHTADCGYKAAVEGKDCAHSHNSLCGYQEASPCSHSHDESCGYREASACAHRHTEECGGNGESCTHSHDEGCGYQEAENCTHSHDESCGYREARDCTHAHDDACGYVEAVTGSPCTYQCEICAQQASQQQNGQERCTHGNESAACETCASEKKVTEVQALINALPEDVTAENKEAAQSALSAVEEAKAALTETEQAQLDLTRCTALKALLAEPDSPNTGKVITDWEWDDGYEIVDEKSGYVILPFTAEAFTANFEQVKGMLPEAILVDGETLPLDTWTYAPGEAGATVTIGSESYLSPGVFKTTLPEGYVLEDGTNVLSLTVALAAGSSEDTSSYADSDTLTNVPYYDANGTLQTCPLATKVVENKVKDGPNTTWTTGWYVVEGTVEIGGTIFLDPGTWQEEVELYKSVSVQGDVNLILKEGSKLQMLHGHIDVPEGSSLTVYCDNTSNSGTLKVWGANNHAAIGGSPDSPDSGRITINGGTVNASSSWGGAGIGSGDGGSAGDITINGGNIEATANYGGAGIGTGKNGKSATITINNCQQIYARSSSGAGIGSGEESSGEGMVTVNIYGGTGITSKSASGAGIGSGKGSQANVTVNIIRGDIYAQTTGQGDPPNHGAAIGGGYDARYTTVNIGGTANVGAKGGKTAPGIGSIDPGGCSVTITGGTVEARGGEQAAGIGGAYLRDSCPVTITGGTVTAYGGNTGAGIGSGCGGNSTTKRYTTGNIAISGGTVTANGGYFAAGIGGGEYNTAGEILISGGTVIAQRDTSKDNDSSIYGGRFDIGDGFIFTNNTPVYARYTLNGSAKLYLQNGYKEPSVQDAIRPKISSGYIFSGTPETYTAIRVYGSQTLSENFCIETGKTMTVTNGASLNANSKLYVKGTLAKEGTGSASGNIYYPLTLTNCTADSSNTSLYNDKLFGKANTSISLTPALQGGYQLDGWTVTPSSVTVSDNSFTMPEQATTVQAKGKLAVEITQQPENKTITYFDDASLSVTAVNSNGTAEEITYQWYKDGTSLERETSATLSLKYLDANTVPYTFYCAVTYDGVTVNSQEATVTVNKATGSVTIDSVPSKTYDGQPASSPGYTFTGSGNVIIKYKVKDAADSTYTENAPTNAGSYTVRVTLPESQNYTGAFNTKDFTITKATNNAWQTDPEAHNFSYGDTVTNPVTYEAKYGNDKVQVTYKKQGTEDTPAPDVPKDAGTYDVTVSLAETDSYPALAPVNLTLTISKAASSVTKAPEDAKSLYTGNPVSLVDTGTAVGGTLHYSLDGENWSADIPTATECGTYTVYYKVVGDNNHNDTEAWTLTAKIVPFRIHSQPHPDSEEIRYGTSIKRSVGLQTNVTEGISYQWCLVTREDGNKEIFTPLEGKTSSELTLTKPNAGEYTYVCIVTCGDYSETSSKATVTVTAVSQGLPTTDLPDGLWVEGGEKPLVDNSIDLKSPSSFLMTSYTYNGASADAHQNYPTGMQIYSVQKDDQGQTTVAPVAELGNLLRYSGCSIRITGKPGIRMITSLTKEAKAALKKGELAGYTLEEYGTVAIWKTNLKDQPLTLETEKANHKYAYKRGVSDPVFANVGNLTQYTNVLVWDTLDAEKYAEDIVMRPYIKLINKDGETVTLYGGTVSRSIGYVAQQNANTFSKGTAGYKYVHEIIDKVNALHSSTGTNTTTGGNG